MRANADICPVDKYPTLTFSYYWTRKNKHIATKYVIKKNLNKNKKFSHKLSKIFLSR
jgi:hypothetical protein